MAMGRVPVKLRWPDPRSTLGRWLVGEARSGGERIGGRPMPDGVRGTLGLGEPGNDGRWLSGDDRAGGCDGRMWMGTALM